MQLLNLFLTSYLRSTALSHTQQDKIMKAFRRKEYRMLVSTPDSAGEGIDVADCNIVINYDFHKSEVSTIQIKGIVGDFILRVDKL